jgi:hypothetical protein
MPWPSPFEDRQKSGQFSVATRTIRIAGTEKLLLSFGVAPSITPSIRSLSAIAIFTTTGFRVAN